MARLSFIIAAAMLLGGCSRGDRVRKLPAFHGQTRSQVFAKLGQPQRDDKFPISKAVGEFRIELQNIYPLSSPANATVEIQEMTWQEGDYWITLWLHQVNGEWVVLDSCRWHKDVSF